MIQVQPVYEPLYENEDKFIILVTGGRGSAKSFNVSTFLERLSFEEGHKMLFCRYTMTSAELSVIPEFNEKIELDETEEHFKVTKTEIVNKYSGSELLFRGIKTSSGKQTAKLKSIQGLTTFVCDEAEEWTDEKDFDKLMLSIRKKGIQLRVIIVMNPPDVNHFIYQRYIKNTHKIIEMDGVDVQVSTHPSVLHIHTTYFDNFDNLNETFLQEASDVRQKSIALSTKSDGSIDKHKFNNSKYAHIVIGRWAELAEGVIFTSYEIVQDIPDWVTKRGVGMDFGFTNDPTAIIDCGLYGSDLYLDERCYKTRMGTGDIIKELKKQNNRVISESADPRLVSEIRNSGVRIKPVDKYPGSVKAGIDKMLELNLKITKRSYSILEELRNYTWDKDKDDNFINEPIDEYNHAIDAARYWVLEEVLGKREVNQDLSGIFGR
jgi:phage terminase, large subunit, PBSX family